MKQFNKKLVIIMRCVLSLAGAVIGYFIMNTVINIYPRNMLVKYRYVYCASAGVLLGLVFMLSTVSLMWLCLTLAGGIKDLFGGKKPRDIIAGIAGIICGGVLTFLLDLLISLRVKIISLRILIDIGCGFAFLGLSVFTATKIIALLSYRFSDDYDNRESFENGFVLTYSALCCEGAEKFCADWLNGSVYVLDCSVSKLIDSVGGEEALKRYRALIDNRVVQTVSGGKGEEGVQIAEFATKKGLKIVSADGDEAFDCNAPVLRLRNYAELAAKCSQPIDESLKKV